MSFPGDDLQFGSSPTSRRRSAFTLVELLVVITIIAILAALLVVAATGAMKTARESQIKVDIDQIDMAFESYSQEISGGDYPPNTMTDDSGVVTGTSASPVNRLVRADFMRHFKRAFPRSAEPAQLLDALIGRNLTSNGFVSNNGDFLIGGMTAAEALVFWLGGFSDDPKFPISGAGGPSYLIDSSSDLQAGAQDAIESRNWIIPLQVERLGPRNDEKFFDEGDTTPNGRFLTYPDPRSGQRRRINLWRYSPKNSTQPLVYFDSSRHLPHEYDMALDGVNSGTIFAIKTKSANSGGEVIRFANENKFQVLHCGIDDDWGDFRPMSLASATSPADVLVYPDGPFLAELSDTIVNFSERNLQNSQP